MLKINEQIIILRKKKGLTQEQLAQLLGISNQAVSKWESGLNCPDIIIIPTLAEIFGVSISELFGEEIKSQNNMLIDFQSNDEFKIVVMKGNKVIDYSLLPNDMKEQLKKRTFELKGDCGSVECYCNVSITGNVNGNIEAGDSVSINGNVGGNIEAGDNVNCGDVKGSVEAGDNVNCGSVGGNVEAGDNVHINNN
ncbi:MAG: DNA-binding protein [Haloplasmataceae bacterium]|nr:DNA-binding protein [Haloplasmataceae bacterium]